MFSGQLHTSTCEIFGTTPPPPTSETRKMIMKRCPMGRRFEVHKCAVGLQSTCVFAAEPMACPDIALCHHSSRGGPTYRIPQRLKLVKNMI